MQANRIRASSWVSCHDPVDLIVPGSTVVDVGGNLGSFTAFFAVATGLEGRVYSFEPQNKMFQVSVRLKIWDMPHAQLPLAWRA
jgi:hypothetical protein